MSAMIQKCVQMTVEGQRGELVLEDQERLFRGHDIELKLEKQAEVTRLKPDCERLPKGVDFILSVKSLLLKLFQLSSANSRENDYVS